MPADNIHVTQTGSRLVIEVDLPPGSAAAPPNDPVALLIAGMPDDYPSHSADFASVNWYGRVFYFAPKQRAVVAALWQTWEEGYDWALQSTLLESADSESQRLRDLFRAHPAWNTMIVQAVLAGGPSGAYRLATR